MKANRIVVTIDDKNGVSMNPLHPLNIEDFMTIFCSLSLGFMRQMLAQAPEGATKTCQDFLYDSFNVAVSKVLSNFAPDYDLHPNLTTKAILEAENKIIEEGRLSEVEPNT